MLYLHHPLSPYCFPLLLLVVYIQYRHYSRFPQKKESRPLGRKSPSRMACPHTPLPAQGHSLTRSYYVAQDNAPSVLHPQSRWHVSLQPQTTCGVQRKLRCTYIHVTSLRAPVRGDVVPIVAILVPHQSHQSHQLSCIYYSVGNISFYTVLPTLISFDIYRSDQDRYSPIYFVPRRHMLLPQCTFRSKKQKLSQSSYLSKTVTYVRI